MQGNQGTQGIQGQSGTSQGIQGIQGPQGTQGIQGRQGTQGIQGNQGTQGIQGQSGTSQGIQGIQGPQGTQGIQGRQGTTGLQGNQGTQGIQGQSGTSQGIQGIQGPQGTQGIQGNQGTQGIQGTTGTGTQGIQGTTGGTPIDGTLLDWDSTHYDPYTANAAGRFSTQVADPTNTTRLNYDGYFYATKLYSAGTEVSVIGHTHTYLPLAGGTMAGTLAMDDHPITFNYASTGTRCIDINAGNRDVNIWEVSDAGTYNNGFYLQYVGTGTLANNNLELYTHNQAGTDIKVYTVTQDGGFTFQSSLVNFSASTYTWFYGPTYIIGSYFDTPLGYMEEGADTQRLGLEYNNLCLVDYVYRHSDPTGVSGSTYPTLWIYSNADPASSTQSLKLYHNTTNGIITTGAGGLSISSFSGSVYITGLGSDEAETYVVAIDNSTGLLTKRSVASMGGGGNVSNTGTPLDNQIAVWTSATVIEGTTGLTFASSILTVATTMNIAAGTITYSDDSYIQLQSSEIDFYTGTTPAIRGYWAAGGLSISATGGLYVDHIYEMSGAHGVSIEDVVYLTALGSDETETYVVAIDNSTGLLSKRSVSSLGAGGGVSMDESTNGYICTVESANHITGESTLTYDGTTFFQTKSGTASSFGMLFGYNLTTAQGTKFLYDADDESMTISGRHGSIDYGAIKIYDYPTEIGISVSLEYNTAAKINITATGFTMYGDMNIYGDSARQIGMQNAPASTAGGNLTIIAGTAVTANYAGGHLYLKGGNAVATAQSGHVYIRGGTVSTAGNVMLAYDGTAYGYVGIRTTASTSYGLYVSGAIYATGNITANSDIRYKHDVKNLTGVLGELNKINPITFRYDEEDSDELHAGYNAQEIEKVFPFISKYDPEKDRLGLKHLGLEAMNTVAIKELKIEKDEDIQSLKLKIDELEKEIKQLKN